MPNRFRPGTGQLGLTGLPTEMIEEFKGICKGKGLLGKDLTYGEMFAKIYTEWKATQQRGSELGKKGRQELHLRGHGGSSGQSQKASGD